MMSRTHRWDPCIHHQSPEATEFLTSFLGDIHRQVGIVAGAGFDPRSSAACEIIAHAAKNPVRALFIREERPNPHPELVRRADENADRMKGLCRNADVVPIDIFASDGAVIGGRAAIQAVQRLNTIDLTDIVVDLSAFSTGVAFPVVRFLLEAVSSKTNLHLVVCDEPLVDGAITSNASDRVSTVHGFQGDLGLDHNANAIKLWLPQILQGKRAVLDRIFQHVSPDEVCPILPFPAQNPRLADELIDHYHDEFESTWGVDARHLVYADERNPLDLYRTILKIADARRRVFEQVGGSLVLLTPLGSKVLSVGSLMAAMERNFPVVQAEAIQYTVDFEMLAGRSDTGMQLIHVWLAGEAFPPQVASEENDAQ